MTTRENWLSSIKEKISAVGSDRSTVPPPLAITSPDSNFAATIDHTLLKPDATNAQIDNLCDEALKYKFKSCCVNGTNIKQVSSRLKGSQVIPCAVIGFPLGAGTSPVKAFETREAVADGAREIDMVINIGALKAQNYDLVHADIEAVVQAAGGFPVKVILETALLTDDEKIAASYIAAEAGASFVKTCTGFSGGAATAEDVGLMYKTVAYKGVKVKASAGLRSFEACLSVLKAGANRIGTSSGAAIMQNAAAVPGSY